MEYRDSAAALDGPLRDHPISRSYHRPSDPMQEIGPLSQSPPTQRWRLFGGGSLLRKQLDLVKALADSPRNHTEYLGAGLAAEVVQFADVGDALLKRLLHGFDALGETIF